VEVGRPRSAGSRTPALRSTGEVRHDLLIRGAKSCPSSGWAGSPASSSARAEAERAFQLAEQFGSVRDGRNALVRWAVLFKGDFVTEPRDLTDLVPADVRTELAAAVAALELHGPAVTNALRRLDRATTAAWNAVNPLDPTQDEWRLVERAVGIDRGWNAAYQLVSTLDPPGQGRSPTNA
jgi:hypothetical protein